ncbi:hypothetical protein FQN57_002830 [Myotisia sp. PD_48]|nr:hypothetical protein FQN57_002830 [Myotisia sp. PD_48]
MIRHSVQNSRLQYSYSFTRCFAHRFTTNNKPISLPVPPPPPTTQHHDLDSFLAYAKRTDLSPETTTYVGTHYEYTVRNTLQRYSLNLTRIGGRSDRGIDLVGTWALPSSPRPLRLIVQCKALKTKAGPNLVRELEGTFVGAPVGWRGEGILGMLMTTREATKGVRDTLANSRFPLIWALAGLDGTLQQFLWNRRAAEAGLEGLGVEVRYAGGPPTVRPIVLTWNGVELPDALSEDTVKS